MKWIDKEEGPNCFCGMPTCVVVIDEQPHLMCIFHSFKAGAIWPLPKDEKPDRWPNVSDEEIQKLIEKAST